MKYEKENILSIKSLGFGQEDYTIKDDNDIIMENASDISEPYNEYDIKPEIHGNANIKIEMTEPSQYENSEQIVPEKKYGKEKQHICLLCDTGYPTKLCLLG